MGLAIWNATSSSGVGISIDSATRYAGIAGCSVNVGQSAGTLLASCEITLAAGGVFSKYSVYASNNARVTNTVLNPTVNGSASALTVTFPGGVTGTIQDTSNTVSVSQNDTVAEQIVTSTGGGNFAPVSSAVSFAATSGTLMSAAQITLAGLTFSGTGPLTDFSPFASSTLGSGTEADQQFSNPVAGTTKYFQLYSSVNGRSTTTVLTIRINGASGNQTLSFGAGVTGLLKDTSNTDMISAGDKICAQTALGVGTGNFTFTMTGVCEAATNSESVVALVRNRSIAAGATSYSVIGGMFNPVATETALQVATGIGGTASKLWARVLTNASTTNATARLRKNAANANQVLTIIALTAGDYQDTTNSDVFTGTDLLGYQFTGATTGSVTYTALSMLLAVATSSPFLAGRPTMVMQTIKRASYY